MARKFQKLDSSEVFDNAKREFTQENSLFDIVKLFFFRLFRVDFNFWCMVFVISVTTLCAVLQSEYDIVLRIGKLIDFASMFAVTTFGFLLTGISLVAAITRKEFFVHLGSHIRLKYRMSELKYTFVLFFYTVACFVSFIFLLVLVNILGVDFFC